ncbi:Lsa36 family surface (lipo)protein [Leptospira sp. GIMC2001]|uniref:Lsa36 family surface (lipo)protein n=1 Tax=Leptospira sp. GIMC2001 TaxID=1513297 RepID=UPI00234AB5CF|nr:hypothetical protein [Leptospira sp. GIMC2001]WCL50584.1 hypothetical protein O4O04_07135 [Leptospira sp. GIMC2001]
MKPNKHSFSILIAGIFYTGILLFGNELYSEVTCTGAACDLLPANVRFQLNSLDTALQTQYTDKVLETITETAVLSNINSAMMGPGIVNRFQVGFGITAAGQQKQDIDVLYQDFAFRGLPNVGASVAPNLNAAFNLGWLLGGGPSDNDEASKNFLHRFNIYLHGFRYNFSETDIENLVKRQDDKIQLAGEVASYGFMLRFHLVPNYSDGLGIFEFSGISLGMGVHYQKQNFNLTYNDTATQAITLGPAIGTWGGATTLDFESAITSIPMDVRTGFRTFYFLTIFAGAGTSLNFGQTTLNFQRRGPIALTLEETLVNQNIPAELQALLPGGTTGQESGVLAVNLRGKANAPNTLSYVVGGVELNILMVKILVEAMASKNVQSVNFGLKLAF